MILVGPSLSYYLLFLEQKKQCLKLQLLLFLIFLLLLYLHLKQKNILLIFGFVPLIAHWCLLIGHLFDVNHLEWNLTAAFLYLIL